MNKNGFECPEVFLNVLVQLLGNIERWKNYPQHTPETVLEHTFKICTLGLLACLIEKKEQQTNIDFFKVMAALLVHDWGEGQVGDVTWSVKNDPRLKKIIEEIEKEKLNSFLTGFLPEAIVADINKLIDVQNDLSVAGNFFRAIERLGYVSYALQEIEKYDRKEFVSGVLENQYDHLERAALQFPSIKIIWEAMKPRVEKFLKKG
ncbi:MAG: HD domain-containing protein [Candidatus Magasanikbacteria bacterium]|nr:HD domain-containing protein [Candidatus Magasanikbacteria bacterium]